MSPTRTAPRPARRAAGSRSPAARPAHRQRRAAVTRRRGRRRLVVVVCLAALAAAAVGGWFLVHSRWLSARVVTVVGSVHTPPAEIAVAGLAGHPPMVDVDPGAAAARLERLPWVRSATVQRQWPDGVRVTVVEETPVAALAPPAGDPGGAGASGAWALVDRDGRVLADRPAPPAGLVRLETPARPGAPGAGWRPPPRPASRWRPPSRGPSRHR